MRRLNLLIIIFATTLAARAALACGGGFGEELEIEPTQEIVVVYKGGSETYVFNPHFCGKAAEFGLILPVPNALTSNPQLMDAGIFTDLTAFIAPEIVYYDVCYTSEGGVGCASEMLAGADGRGAGGGGGDYGGVDVIDAGQVGIFDWTLLHATNPAAFTDWLEANGYPYEPQATTHFAHYVTVNWYFVAFQITADDSPPEGGLELCGAFGPIALEFPTDVPVIPARITATDTAGEDFKRWTIYTIAEEQLRLRDAPAFYSELAFSGEASSDDLSIYARLGDLVSAGDWITALEIEFSAMNLEDDVILETDPMQRSYREIEYRANYVECPDGPCSGAGTHWLSTAALGGLLVLVVARIKRWRRAKRR